MFNPGGRARLAVQASTITPRTPEILDEVSAWLPPNFSHISNNTCNINSNSNTTSSSSQIAVSSNGGCASSVAMRKLNQCDSHSSCSGSPLDSPGCGGSNAPPSVEQTHSKLVKATLKLSLEMKRKNSGSGCDSVSEPDNCKMAKLEYETSDEDDEDDDDDDLDSKSMRGGLTPEDEDRRRKRRERNKIAATKCRKKKRERTNNLVTEAEYLEKQNVDLLRAVRQLEMERRQLTETLQSHCATQSQCGRPFKAPTAPTIAVERFLGDLAVKSDAEGCKPTGRNSQPIPSVTTIGRFGGAKASTAKTRTRATVAAAGGGRQAANSKATVTSTPAAAVEITNIPTTSPITNCSSSISSNINTPEHPPLIVDANLIPPSGLVLDALHPQLGDLGDLLLSDAPSIEQLLLPNNYCKASPDYNTMSPDHHSLIQSPAHSLSSGYSTVTPVSVALSSPMSAAGATTTFLHQLNNNNNVSNVNQNMLQHKSNGGGASVHLAPVNSSVELASIVDTLLTMPPQHQQHFEHGNSMQQQQHHNHLFNGHQQHNSTQHSHHHQQQHNNHQNMLLNSHHHSSQHQHNNINNHHHTPSSHQLRDALIGPGDGSEFALKCELIDSAVHSPYTREQSADQFLYDSGLGGADDSSVMFSDTAGLVLEQAELKMLTGQMQHNNTQHQQNLQQQHQQHQPSHQHHQQQSQHNNVGMHQQQQHLQHMQLNQSNHQQQHANLGPVEFASYSSQADFMTDLIVGSDAQFIDMDSGNTYASFLQSNAAANNGCMT